MNVIQEIEKKGIVYAVVVAQSRFIIESSGISASEYSILVSKRDKQELKKKYCFKVDPETPGILTKVLNQEETDYFLSRHKLYKKVFNENGSGRVYELLDNSFKSYHKDYMDKSKQKGEVKNKEKEKKPSAPVETAEKITECPASFSGPVKEINFKGIPKGVPELVIREICQKIGTPRGRFLEKSRAPAVVRSRHIFSYIALTVFKVPPKEFEKESSIKRCAALHGVKKVKELSEAYPEFKEMVIEVKSLALALTREKSQKAEEKSNVKRIRARPKPRGAGLSNSRIIHRSLAGY